jgi:hypothetical protein
MQVKMHGIGCPAEMADAKKKSYGFLVVLSVLGG